MNTFIRTVKSAFLTVLFFAVAQQSVADPASEWDLRARSTLGPLYLINSPYIHLSMYNAVNYIEGKYTLYTHSGVATPTADKTGASQVAAAIAAAYYSSRESLAQSNPAACTTSHSLYSQFQQSLAVNGVTETDPGVLIGEQAAEGIVGSKFCKGVAGVDGGRRNDGNFPVASQTPNSYVFPTLTGPNFPYPNLIPGTYLPTLPTLPTSTTFQPAFQWFLTTDLFFLKSIDQFRLDPPPAINSDEYTIAFNEVKLMGVKLNSGRTPEQTQIGLFWSANIVPQISDIIRGIVSENPKFNLSLADITRFYAMTFTATIEAEIACMDSKYTYKFWRPETAIRNADYDGNPATTSDSTWLPTFTSGTHPEYPSGHSCWAGAIAESAEQFFGTKKLNVLVSSAGVIGAGPCDAIVNGTCRRIIEGTDNFEKEMIDARVWAGSHYRFSGVRGVHLGEKISKYLYNHTPYFQPIDNKQ